MPTCPAALPLVSELVCCRRTLGHVAKDHLAILTTGERLRWRLDRDQPQAKGRPFTKAEQAGFLANFGPRKPKPKKRH